ncbi:hypothetical protein [Candidatus Nitrotoga arctica]|uniref:Uncharacterized protein n=1 Tax=Candidatus Nitrotoga arctica TaxID=453162 RepID=A0ABM8YY01_9PROT|nr:hypothetical protein [Candidatus Nitrotoga arctica]CAG9932425.1 protein of unknown function [Candidatus Nitrotoga arctica]
MIANILTLANISHKVNTQVERLMMMQDLTRLTIKSVEPDGSDATLALLNGILSMLSIDTENMHRFFEDLEIQLESEVAHA